MSPDCPADSGPTSSCFRDLLLAMYLLRLVRCYVSTKGSKSLWKNRNNSIGSTVLRVHGAPGARRWHLRLQRTRLVSHYLHERHPRQILRADSSPASAED